GPVSAKPRHLLSGLTKCGCCGASYTILGKDRIGCAGHRERGDCDNSRSITRAHVEERVLAAMDSYLADPDMIAVYIAEYHATRRALLTTKAGQRERLVGRALALDKQIDNIVDLIVDGRATMALTDRLRVLEAERDDL